MWLTENVFSRNGSKRSSCEEKAPEAKGWLVEVMRCVEAIGRPEFTLHDVYASEARLSAIYPENNNVRPKIRQKLQVLRDKGYLDFMSRGVYRLRSPAEFGT